MLLVLAVDAEAMMTLIYKIKKYWYIPLFVLGLILLYVIFRRRRVDIVDATLIELKAIDTAYDVKKQILIHGAEAEKKRVTEIYKRNAHAMSVKQRRRAEALKEDPSALSKLLVRCGHL